MVYLGRAVVKSFIGHLSVKRTDVLAVFEWLGVWLLDALERRGRRGDGFLGREVFVRGVKCSVILIQGRSDVDSGMLDDGTRFEFR